MTAPAPVRPVAADISAAPASRPLVAAAWICMAIVAFSTMAVAGRVLRDVMSPFEIMFWRSALGMPLIIALLAISAGGFSRLGTSRPGLHAGRHVVHFAGQILWFYAIAVIPLAQVVALEFTSPVWVALLAPLFLGERLTQAKMAAAAIGFAGVLLVARPGVIEVGVGQMAALGAAIGFALTNIATKSLTRTDATLTIVFWMTLSQTAMALASVAVQEGGGAPPIPPQSYWLWLLVIAAAGFAAHFSLTNAYRAADATIVAPMEFARLPVIAIAAALIFAEALDPWVLIGGAVIFAGNFLNIRAERRRRAAG